MNYSEYFKSILLEFDNSSSSNSPTTPAGTPRRPRYDNPEGAMDQFLDDDTDPKSFTSDDGGIKQKVEEVRDAFEQEVAQMANRFVSDNLTSLSLGELREISDSATSTLGSVQNNFKPKPGTEYSRSAVIANSITSSADKEAAFNDLTKTLQEFNKSINELEVLISTVGTKFGAFIKTLQKPVSDDELENLMGNQEDSMSSGGADSTVGAPPQSPL